MEPGLRNTDDPDRTLDRYQGDDPQIPARRQGDSFRLKAFGLDIVITGSQIITIMLVTFLLLGAGWLATKHDETTHQLAEQIEAMTFVIALPQDKREALDLAMPNALRNMRRNH